MAIIVKNLTDYVEQRRLPLIQKAVLTPKSASLMTLQTDIKTQAALNLIDTDVKFSDGSICGWSDTGSSYISQRVLKTGNIKINMSFCDKELLNYWTQYEVRVAAGQKTLPFEEDFVNSVIESVKAANEVAIWQGDTTKSGANINKFDGLLKILNEADGVINYSYTGDSGETAKSLIMKCYEQMPAEVFSKKDVVIFVGNDLYRSYVNELVEANLYHFDPTAAGQADFIYLPGTDVRVIGVDGLNNTGAVVGGNLSNFFVGVDMMNDDEKFEMWYSQDNREFRLAIEYNLGVQVAYPDLISMCTESE